VSLEPEFLSVEDVIFLHDEQLVRFGGATGIRDQGLLESAIGMPQASFAGEYLHEDLFTMAAAYAFHIAQNQAFVDGNKRTGLLSALVFLDLNGVIISDPDDLLYQAMIDIAERTLDKAGLALLLRVGQAFIALDAMSAASWPSSAPRC
jgi:death-on-curing protein